MLIFGTALLALMAGALLYVARVPVETNAPEPPPATSLEVVSHPEFTLPDLEGSPRTFSEWSGSHRLLNFWATWCPPCVEQMPGLAALQRQTAAWSVVGWDTQTVVQTANPSRVSEIFQAS